MPNAARKGTARHATRSVRRRHTARTAKRTRNAPVARTSVSRSELTPPDWRITFETPPLTAHSVAAVSTIAYPSEGRRLTAASVAAQPRDPAAGRSTLGSAGRSAAWLARLLWEQEVAGSNP